MDQERIIRQLHRIEGQVRGIEQMVATDRGLVATVQQLLAVRSALRTVMTNYVELFLEAPDEGRVVLTREQVSYLLKLIDR